jgi:hypothetical protein
VKVYVELPHREVGQVTIFPFEIGEVAGLYNRILKTRPHASDTDSPDRTDVVTISSEAKRQKVLEETQSAVLVRIRNGG